MIRCVIPALPEAVSVALLGLMRNAALARFDADSRSTLELVLAEVLNNVVEHAYAHYPGSIEVMLWPGADGIRGCIVDSGLPMPNGQVPAGDPPDLVGDLPEGGLWLVLDSQSDNGVGLSPRRQPQSPAIHAADVTIRVGKRNCATCVEGAAILP